MSVRRQDLCGWNSAFCAALVCCALACAASADERNAVSWHSDVNTAWKTTQEDGRPLLVFVTGKDCKYCTKMKQGTLANPAVAATINRSFVALIIDGENPSPLLKDLGVTGYPTTFVISRDAVILERVNGYVPPDVMMSRLAAIGATADKRDL